MKTRSQTKLQTYHQKVEEEPELVVNEDNFRDTEELLASSRHTHVKLEKSISEVKKSSKILQLKHQKTTSKIFRAVWQNQVLVSLNIQHFNLHCIDPEILSSLPVRLKKLVMNDTGLSEDQTLALFSGIARSKTLTDMDLILIDLSGVGQDTMTRALAKLGRALFRECELDSEQVEAVLKLIANECSLRELVLTGSEDEPLDLTEVNPDIFALAVNKLERFNLCNAVVKSEQADKLLQQVLVKTDLKSLGLSKLTHEDGTRTILNKDLARKVRKEIYMFETL